MSAVTPRRPHGPGGRGSRVIVAVIALIAAVILAACGSSSSSSSSPSATSSAPASSSSSATSATSSSKGSLTLGTKDFTEEFVVGQLYKQALAAKGCPVNYKENIGATEVVDKALTSHQIDAYPEYTGESVATVGKINKTVTSPQEEYNLAKSFYAKRRQVMSQMTPFFDTDAIAVKKAYATKYGLVTTEDLTAEGSVHTLRISRLMVTGVVEAPNGAHFTECPPDYGRDEAFQKEYAATASSPELWDAFKEKDLDVENEAEYQRVIGARP